MHNGSHMSGQQMIANLLQKIRFLGCWDDAWNWTKPLLMLKQIITGTDGALYTEVCLHFIGNRIWPEKTYCLLDCNVYFFPSLDCKSSMNFNLVFQLKEIYARGIYLKHCLASALNNTLSSLFPGREKYYLSLKNSPSLKYLDRLPLCSQAQSGLGSSAAVCQCCCVILTFTWACNCWT